MCICELEILFPFSLCREYHELSSVGKRSVMQPVLDAFEGLTMDEGRDQNSEAGSAPMPLLVPVQGSSGLTLQKFLPYLKKMSPGQPTEGELMHCIALLFWTLHASVTPLLSFMASCRSAQGVE